MKNVIAALLVWAACAGIASAKTYDSIPFPQGQESRIVPDASLPDKKSLPQQSAPIPGTSFVVIQSRGGSLLLGPLMGSANIKAKTKELADQSKGSGYVGTDIGAIATQSLTRIGVAAGTADGAYVLRPFSFAQQCEDGKMRFAVVYDVTGPGPKNPWRGRYSYHLPTPIPAEQFNAPSPEQVQQFVAEVTAGADALTSLIERDMKGALPATGKKVKFGSLDLQGNKMGGLGIYTMPETMAYENVQLIEEKDGYVIVRINGNPNATALFGGLLFGVHRMRRDAVHTLTE